MNNDFNTIEATHRLEAAGLTREQAEALVICLQEVIKASQAGLATKQDLAELRAETRHDIAELHAQMNTRFAEFEARFQRTLRIHTAVILGAMGTMLGGFAAMLAVLFQFAGN